jgi:hypothetical protein
MRSPVIITRGGTWFREGRVVVDVKHAVIARFGRSVIVNWGGRSVKNDNLVFRTGLYILSAYPGEVTVPGLIDLLWGERADGGPLQANIIIQRVIYFLRPVLRELGIIIRATWRWGGGFRAEFR